MTWPAQVLRTTSLLFTYETSQGQSCYGIQTGGTFV